LTVTQWTELNYQPFKEACQRICEGNPLYEELTHYVLSEFLGKTDVQSIVQSGGAFFYCLRMATNNWKSTTSPFYRNYRDPNLNVPLNERHYQEREDPQEEDLGTEHAPSSRTKAQMNGIEQEGDWTWEELYEHVSQGMETLGWYEKELIKVYAENNGNASLVSRLTKIPRTSINLTVKKVRIHLMKGVR
jgi:hypothetical protein